ncbi:hypothetical protein [Azorhizobium sp. AG788]|uniref:hypothetical protein n=1 Tax=Azorhizobium sp. AG788 TaxID=2183897 RepID=UPI003139E3C9
MSAKALKLHLPHFGTPRIPRPAGLQDLHEKPTPAPADPAATPAAADTPAAPPRPAKPAGPDHAAILAAAVAAARSEALASARQEFEAERSRDAEAFDAHLALARQQWAAETAETLQGNLTSAHEAMEARICDTLGRILVPFLSDAVRAQALQEMSALITRLLKDPKAPMLRISGPDVLLDVLRARHEGAAIEFQTSDAVDVRVTADDTVIETQLRAWTTHLTEALA